MIFRKLLKFVTKTFFLLGNFLEIDNGRGQDYTVDELRCVICKVVVSEIEDTVNQMKSKAVTNVGSYRIDAKGNMMSKSIPLVQSEAFLIETMEKACASMEDYARGYDKKTKKLKVVKLKMGEQLNPEMSNINAISDADLNESLRFHCDDITDQFEKNFIEVFKQNPKDSGERICTDETRLCKAEEVSDDEL